MLNGTNAKFCIHINLNVKRRNCGAITDLFILSSKCWYKKEAHEILVIVKTCLLQNLNTAIRKSLFPNDTVLVPHNTLKLTVFKKYTVFHTEWFSVSCWVLSFIYMFCKLIISLNKYWYFLLMLDLVTVGSQGRYKFWVQVL